MQQALMTQTSALTQEEVDFYQEHGWLKTRSVIADHLIDSTLQGLEQHWTGHRDRVLAGAGKGFADWMPGGGDGTRNNEYLSLQNRLVSQLAWSRVVGEIAANAAQVDGIRLFDDQIVYKPGGQTNAVVGWHVDGDYWGTCSSQKMLTAWIPLHDCPEELGPIVVLDGSHRWSHLLDRSAFSFHRTDMELLRGYIEDLGYEFKPVVLEMKRGEFSLHHCRTIHGSYPNRGTRPRIALAVHMQDTGNRYREAFRPDGRPVQLFNDTICGRDAQGFPDYSDDSVFPLMWSRAE
jgi:hypothetical protein